MKPTLETTRNKIRRVAQAWRKAYAKDGVFTDPKNGEIYSRLLDLNLETCAASDVAAAIGNGSWSTIRCDACDSVVDAIVTVGQTPDYPRRDADE